MRFIKVIIVILITVCFYNCKSKVKVNTPALSNNTTIKKPNILIIYPDQLRRYSAGFWSEDKYAKHVVGKPDPVITPNIDNLAKNGVVFTQAVSNFPLCSPARGMLLTGMYPEQNGIWNNCHKTRDDSLKDDVSTITDLFFEAGYNTSYFGKCHWLKNDPLFDENGNYIGTTEKPGGNYLNNYDTYIPPGKSRHNIEYFYQAVKDVHFDPLVFSNIPNTIEGKKDGELHQPKIFTPKNEAQKIAEYLKNKSNQRDSNKPFCMIWSLNPPHNPWNDKSTDMEMLHKYYDEDNFPKIDKSLIVRENADLEKGDHVRHYFANVTSVDKYIGEVMKSLKEVGELKNTIIIVSSDHGEMLGSHGKKGKNVPELEAYAVPFIVHWPNQLKSGVTDVLFSVTDVLPTIMGLSGLHNKIPKEVQGNDFTEIIKNNNSSSVEKPEAVLFMLSKYRGVLSNRYSLYLKKPKKEKANNFNTLTLEEGFIYDNENDPYQLNRLSLKDKPLVAKNLLTKLGVLLKKANDPWYQKKLYSNFIPY